jgi:hypothetical protein
MNRIGVRTRQRLDGLLWRIGLPVVALLAAVAPALAGPQPGGPQIAHLHSPAMQAAAGDVVLGAGAATAILAGMVVVLAVSWRGFRDSMRIEADDELPQDVPPARRRRDGDA